MAYAINIIKKMVEAVSPLEGKPDTKDFLYDIPGHKGSITLQNDEIMYVISKGCFGQLSWGLSTGQPAGVKELLPEIKEFQPIFIESDREFYALGEEYYSKPIISCFKKGLSLDGIDRLVEDLSALPDDQKVRLILGDDRGRVISRSRYMEMMEKKEDKMLQNFLDMNEPFSKVSTTMKPENIYTSLMLPDAVFMTPYLMISFPRAGRMDFKEPNVWRKNTELKVNTTYSSILNFDKPSVYRSSPFAVSITVNAADLNGKNSDEEAFEYLEKVKEQLKVLEPAVGLAKEYVNQFNELHNSLWAEKIRNTKWFKPEKL